MILLSFLFFHDQKHFMFCYQDIQKQLLRAFFDDDIKISFFMNCLSFFNRQKYLIVISYFIDFQWIYREILFIFEHISDFYIEKKLTKIVQNVVIQHELKKRLYVVINDNAFNNLIMHTKLNRLLHTSRMFVDVETNVHEIKRVSCLVHVI
jgi:hypothetical protein